MEKTFAIVENGVVTNTVLINDNDTETINLLGATSIPEGVEVSIGFLYANNVFVNPNPVPDVFNMLEVEPVMTFDEIQAVLDELTNGS